MFARMNLFSSSYSEPLADHFPESSSGSNDSNSYLKAHISDEEVLLASNNPKRRAGRKKFRETRHPVYRGVRRRNSGKWVCEVREPNKKTRIWLGTFPTAEMAARAHDVAAIALRGRSACLNFADSAWRLPIPSSSEAKDIQKAAAEAAEAFKPTEFGGTVSGDDAKDIQECTKTTTTSTTMTTEEAFFMDEEAVFGMPGLLVNMAEGMMLPPPPPQCPIQDGYDLELTGTDVDVSLWSYSI